MMRKAFNLTEVLITIGIVGVVAALTLPSLIVKYRIKQHEIAFKTADAMIQEALKKSLYEIGYSDVSELNFNKTSKADNSDRTYLAQVLPKLNETFLNQFKGKKQLPDCSDLYHYKHLYQYDFFGNIRSAQCYTSETFGISGGTYNTYILPNNITISDISFREKLGYTYYNAGIQISFDTNGPYKGPNRYGHDIFTYVSNPYAEDIICNPAITHSRNTFGCYFFAQKNQSPLDPSEPYWNLLYTSPSYWLNYNKNK